MTGVQTCALPICVIRPPHRVPRGAGAWPPQCYQQFLALQAGFKDERPVEVEDNAGARPSLHHPNTAQTALTDLDGLFAGRADRVRKIELFLILGTFLDGAVMLLVFIPVLIPSARALGIDLVHFGVVAILNFMIAMITPPYGLILFVLSALTGVPMRDINREIWQFCVPLTLVLFLLILVPDTTLWLPRVFGYGK